MKIQILWTALFSLSMVACSSLQSDDQGGEQMEMVTHVTDQDLEGQLDKPAPQPVPTTLPPAQAESSAEASAQHEEEIEPPTTIPVPQQTEQPAPAMPKEKEPPVPKVAAAAKVQTAELKFKLNSLWKNKPISAKAHLKEDKKTVQVKLSGLNFKKGLYTLMVVDSCKKTAKGKPRKLVAFNVKKTGKFSDSSVAKTFRFSNVKGKAVALYFGPKAKTRLDCASVK